MWISNAASAPASPAKPWLIAIAASAEGIPVTGAILSVLPTDVPAAVMVIHGQPPDYAFGDLLRRVTRLPVRPVVPGERVEPGVVYLVGAGASLTLTPDRTFLYRDATSNRSHESSVDALLESAAHAFHGHVIAVVLSGADRDVIDGVLKVKAQDGVVIAQDPATADHPRTLRAAVESGAVDYVLPGYTIGRALSDIVHGLHVSAAGAPSSPILHHHSLTSTCLSSAVHGRHVAPAPADRAKAA
jgi:chemotaxis response regulator CheB